MLFRSRPVLRRVHLAQLGVALRDQILQLPDGVLHAAAHVTGGGIIENLPRVLPDGLEADVAWGSWPEPPVFELLRAQTDATEQDLRSTFNLGVGMVLVVPPALAERAIAHASGLGSAAFPIGVVRA